MPEIIRTKETRYRDDYSSDDERSSQRSRPSGGYKTVQRYRVTPSRALVPADADDDRRSMRSERLDVGTRHHRLEVDRRVERVDKIERPRSALEYREPDRDREVRRTIVYERARSPQPVSPRPWERQQDRPWERDEETDVKIVRRRREREEEPVEVERFTREIDYYERPDPPPQPIVIRTKAPEPPTYEVVRREKIIDNREVVPVKVPRAQEDDYYFRRDVREAEPRRDELVRSDRRDERRDRRRESYSEASDSGSEVIVRKEKRIIRERSHSPRHKLHIAEGALAGAGAAALIANHRDKNGEGSGHRGRKVVGGAALGALGAELVTRARSTIRERERSRNRSRSRSSSSGGGGNHSKLKTGIAVAAGLALAAAAGKYIQSRNERKDEMGRGRSRTRSRSRRRRYSDDDDGVSKHSDPKHRAATMAKAAAGAATVAGLVEHYRSKSRGRSQSRLRTGGIVAATGLAGAAVAGLYENRKAKQDAADNARGRSDTSRSRSRARSRSRGFSSTRDPELGMVEYGGDPVYTHDPAAAAAERSRERRERSSRSRSRVKDIATGALASGAAAIGIDKYKKRKERREAERERRRMLFTS